MSDPVFKCPKCGNLSYMDAPPEKPPPWMYALCMLLSGFLGTTLSLWAFS